MKNLLYLVLVLFLSSCFSSKNYYIQNQSIEEKHIEVHYISNNENLDEVISPPDSLGVIDVNLLKKRSYKWYQNSNRQIPFQKINDTIYRFTLQKQEKTMIPYRYYYGNSLKKMLINQEEEILFTEFQYDSDSLSGFKTKNTKLGTIINFKDKFIIGDDYYTIELR